MMKAIEMKATPQRLFENPPPVAASIPGRALGAELAGDTAVPSDASGQYSLIAHLVKACNSSTQVVWHASTPQL